MAKKNIIEAMIPFITNMMGNQKETSSIVIPDMIVKMKIISSNSEGWSTTYLLNVNDSAITSQISKVKVLFKYHWMWTDPDSGNDHSGIDEYEWAFSVPSGTEIMRFHSHTLEEFFLGEAFAKEMEGDEVIDFEEGLMGAYRTTEVLVDWYNDDLGEGSTVLKAEAEITLDGKVIVAPLEVEFEYIDDELPLPGPVAPVEEG